LSLSLIKVTLEPRAELEALLGDEVTAALFKTALTLATSPLRALKALAALPTTPVVLGEDEIF